MRGGAACRDSSIPKGACELKGKGFPLFFLATHFCPFSFPPVSFGPPRRIGSEVLQKAFILSFSFSNCTESNFKCTENVQEQYRNTLIISSSMSTFWKNHFIPKKRLDLWYPSSRQCFNSLLSSSNIPSLSPPYTQQSGHFGNKGLPMLFTSMWKPMPSHPWRGQEAISIVYHQEGGGEEKEVTVGGARGCLPLLLLQEGASTRSELHLTKPPAIPPVVQFTLSATGGE